MKPPLDSHQLIIEKKLQQLAKSLEEQAMESAFFKLFKKNKTSSKGCYIYGDVGRGKSMLMKNFFNSLQKTSKVYFHFNSFMRAVHEALRDIRNGQKKYSDELIEAVKRVIKNNRIICFDEFQVTDITDAMLLSRIFSYLFSRGAVVVFTSNSHPLELYKNGLQRELFLEFINKILLRSCEILHLNSPTDYRSKLRQNLSKRYFISNKKNRGEIKKIIADFTGGKKSRSKKINVWGREIKIKKTYDKIAVLDFDWICRSEFSASDYQTICRNFDLIFLLKLPSLAAEEVNEARRFTLFIDEVYENKTALIILAKTRPEKIYQSLNHGNAESDSFRRTISRLNEIKSDLYWQESKINQISGVQDE